MISLIVENWLGAYAASLATVGVIAVTPPDVAAPRRGKLRTMMLPFIAGVPVFYIVQLLNGRHLKLNIFLTFFSFLAFLAMAWGKRGIPVAMGMMFTAIFSVATKSTSPARFSPCALRPPPKKIDARDGYLDSDNRRSVLTRRLRGLLRHTSIVKVGMKMIAK